MTSARKSNTTKNCSFLVRVLFLAVAVSAGVAGNARAQSSASQTRVVTAQLGGEMKAILTVQKVGDAVRLEDGRFEQRYEVTANVAFRFVSAAGAGENVRAADASREVALAEVNGRAGYRSEYRVRADSQAALVVTAERR